MPRRRKANASWFRPPLFFSLSPLFLWDLLRARFSNQTNKRRVLRTRRTDGERLRSSFSFAFLFARTIQNVVDQLAEQTRLFVPPPFSFPLFLFSDPKTGSVERIGIAREQAGSRWASRAGIVRVRLLFFFFPHPCSRTTYRLREHSARLPRNVIVPFSFFLFLPRRRTGGLPGRSTNGHGPALSCRRRYSCPSSLVFPPFPPLAGVSRVQGEGCRLAREANHSSFLFFFPQIRPVSKTTEGEIEAGDRNAEIESRLLFSSPFFLPSFLIAADRRTQGQN